jgi:hypothetical protein
VEPNDRTPIILDLRRQKPKRVKQLRKGGGPLLDDINGTLAELRESGGLPADATPIVVVVREKVKAPKGPGKLLRGLAARRLLGGL